ncbi:MAG: hypothetical protein WC050_04015, partial [Candidatus Paceibacterota bacterium]
MKHAHPLFKKLVIASVIAAIFSVIGVQSAYHDAKRQAAISYFAYALLMNRARETVIVADKRYSVESGVAWSADGSAATEGETYEALRLAYALSLARRSPILGMEGTAPNKLRDATDKLDRVAKELSSVQTNDADRDAVSKALYPTGFLRSLADLEEARNAFIASGKDTDEAMYQNRLGSTIGVAERDLQRFKKAYTNMQETRFAVPSGVVTKDGVLGTLQNIEDGFDSVRREAKRRDECTGGKISACQPEDLRLTNLKRLAGEGAAVREQAVRPLTREVVSIREAAAGSRYSRDAFVSLSRSGCMSMLSAPYLFVIRDPSYSPSYPVLESMDDLYFSRINEGTAGAFEGLGISYLLYVPTTFYACPESAKDLARAKA